MAKAKQNRTSGCGTGLWLGTLSTYRHLSFTHRRCYGMSQEPEGWSLCGQACQDPKTQTGGVKGKTLGALAQVMGTPACWGLSATGKDSWHGDPQVSGEYVANEDEQMTLCVESPKRSAQHLFSHTGEMKADWFFKQSFHLCISGIFQ